MTEFEKIYRLYFDQVYRYLRRLSGNEQTAEEITAETFLKAMSAIDSFRGDCDLRVWLCQIGKNCYFSRLKKEKVTEPLEKISLPSGEDTEEELMAREDAARIREILHHVPEPYKEVFMWRVFGDLSFREIGQIFGKSDNWACVTYHRCRKAILAELEENQNEK